MIEKPRFILFAGVNGSGKSTFYDHALENLDPTLKETNRINPDEIIREFNGDSNSQSDQFKSGKIAVKRMNKFIESQISFNQETTLAGNVKRQEKIFQWIKEQNFLLELYYVSVESVDLAQSRVKARVDKGGHNIPNDTIERRYYSSQQNLTKLAQYFDKITVFDNSKHHYQRVFEKHEEQVLINRSGEKDFAYLKEIIDNMCYS